MLGAQALAAPPLLLTAGDGPWAWTRARYTLLDGALDDKQTTYSAKEIERFPRLGSTLRTQMDNAVSFEFGKDVELDGSSCPLTLSLASYEHAGVGGTLWDAGVALTLLGPDTLGMPENANVLELGAGIGLPGIALSRHSAVKSVTLTDARPYLMDVLKKNAHAAHPVADVHVAQLQWGGGLGDKVTGADGHADANGMANETLLPNGQLRYSDFADRYDVVLGSDICYEEHSVPHLTSLIRELHAPLSILIGPATRPSMRALAHALKEIEGVQVEERRLTLVCHNAARDDDAKWPSKAEAVDGVVRSSGVHMLLKVRQ